MKNRITTLCLLALSFTLPLGAGGMELTLEVRGEGIPARAVLVTESMVTFFGNIDVTNRKRSFSASVVWRAGAVGCRAGFGSGVL